MKKKKIIKICFILLIIVMTQISIIKQSKAEGQQENTVIICNDYNFYETLVDSMDKTKISTDESKLTITASTDDINKVNELSFGSKNIKDISGIENLKKLRKLDLSNNNISDISKLSSLDNLETLNLSNNKIIDISSLENLKKIEYLNLSNNKVNNIKNICFDNLKYFDCSYNEIEDISILENKADKTNFIEKAQVVQINTNNGAEVELPPIISQAMKKFGAKKIKTTNCEVNDDYTKCTITKDVANAKIEINDGNLDDSIVYFNLNNIDEVTTNNKLKNKNMMIVFGVFDIVLIIIISVIIIAKKRNKNS